MKILFINQSQFGYHVDYYKYCEYLRNDYNITYLCWDYDRPKIHMIGIDIVYISRNDNVLIRNLTFLKNCISHILNSDYDLVFIHYFRSILLLRILCLKQLMLVDIRTGSIDLNSIKRKLNNLLLKFEVSFFNNVSCISDGLAQELKLKKNVKTLPLGGELLDISFVKRKQDELRLLYVGTFNNRSIEKTILGVKLFIEKNPHIQVSYTIIGSGWNDEIKLFNNYIEECQLQNMISIKGYIPNGELHSYLALSDVGISFVPLVECFQHQPPTKTYEYLLSGLPVLATATEENKLIVNSCNGILIKDTPQSFASGLDKIYKNINNYSSDIIKQSVSKNTWKNIVSTLNNTIISKLLEKK